MLASANVHPLAPEHLPWFITAPGSSDTLFTITTIVVVATTILLGVMFFWLHSLPERMGHRKLQFEVVAVLGLLSLFTGVHIFWVTGLLLALIDLPDLLSPLRRMATAAEKMAGISDPSFAAPPAKGEMEESAKKEDGNA